MGMQLTEENYYSDIANYEYMSVSQFKDFNGTYGRVACEEAALAKLKGEYAQASSTALMVGSYVDRYFEGTLDAFKSEHTEMFKKDGNLKAEYVKADTQEKMEKAKRIRNTRHASMMDGHPMNCAKRLKITRKNWFEREQRVNT